MLIVVIRTDNPEAEIGLYDDERQLAYEKWQAHRQLAETIHLKLRDMLKGQGKELADLGGVVAYKGPGSFTGLRIGLSVANALGSSYGLPMVGATDDDWAEKGVHSLLAHTETSTIVLPEYGSPVHITPPKH